MNKSKPQAQPKASLGNKSGKPMPAQSTSTYQAPVHFGGYSCVTTGGKGWTAGKYKDV